MSGKVLNRLLISDNLPSKCEEILSANGIHVTCKYNLSEDQLINELKGFDGLVVRSSTKVTKKVIDSCADTLKLIGRAGTGLDNIDVKTATEKNIKVLNTPNANSISACELTCSLISSIARNVPMCCNALKEGKWLKKSNDGSELFGKTLAIIGLGNIGKQVAIRMNAFQMNIVGYDPFVSDEEGISMNVKMLKLDDIWPIADYITVHTPLIPETRNLINAAVLDKCKRGVKIINVARGGIVNELDLLNALETGVCGGAALDVFTEEPPKNSTLLKLIGHPKVIATPHLGASTVEAQLKVAVELAERIVQCNKELNA